MQLSRRSVMGLFGMSALAVSASLDGQTLDAQIQQPRPTSPSNSQSGLPDITGGKDADASASPLRERMRITAERAHDEDRRKRMLADTDKLLALSTELKEYIEKTTKDELSMDVIRKAAEIEKLAHDVQQRMKN